MKPYLKQDRPIYISQRRGWLYFISLCNQNLAVSHCHLFWHRTKPL